MASPFKQRDIERAMRAARRAGLSLTSTECHPDGRFILCFGHSEIEVGDHLDQELEEWRRKNAPN